MDISVVVACKNEEAFIVDCVQSILASIQFAGVDGEVLVYDGISTDNTWFLVDQLSKKDQRVKGHINDEQTAPFAFNKGIRAAESPVIMIFGAHATMGQTHISEVLETLKSYPDAGCVGGLINNIYHDDLGRAIGEAMNSKVGVGNATFRTGGAKGYVDTVAFGAYKKEVFEQIGLFNTSLTRNQDDEFNYRLTKAGFKIVFNPVIESSYYVRSSIAKLWSQYYQYGYWKVYVNQLHKAVTSVRQLVPFGLVLYTVFSVLFSAFLAFAEPRLILLIWIPLFAYLLLIVSTSFSKSTKQKVNFLILVQSFLTLHFSYGLGYSKGIFDFVVRRKKPSQNASKLTR